MSEPVGPAQSLVSTASTSQPATNSQQSSAPPTGSSQASSSTVGQIHQKRGPYKRHKTGLKRKRGKIKKSDEESDEEFTFDGLETKSGRKVHKPQQFDPLADLDGGRKRTAYFRRDLQICKVCSRGHSPESNLIVFCDGCNDPYHQLCHDPPIGRAFIEVAEAQWFCSNCQSKIVERELEVGLSGANLTEEEKRTYLLSLPTQHLVELLLMCERQHPDLQIYSPNIKSFLSQRRQPSSGLVSSSNSTDAMKSRTRTQSEGAASVPVQVMRTPIDDTTPLPGSGSQIPPETGADAHYLLDDDTTVFSHAVYSVPSHPYPPPHQYSARQIVVQSNGALNGIVASGQGVG